MHCNALSSLHCIAFKCPALHFTMQVKLLCPMDGSPAPIIEWSKGEEMVDYQMTRYRTNKKSLKIRNVNIEDSGRYVQFICNVLI